MKEVTNQTPYNQYHGKCFICSLTEAEKFVHDNCKKAHHIDIVNNIYGQLENKVWWENEHTHNDAGTKKIAHYNAKRNLLVIYYHNNII